MAALSRDRYGCGHIWAQSVKPLQMWQRLHQWRNSCATEPLFMFWCAPKSDGVATVLITKSNFAGASGDHSVGRIQSPLGKPLVRHMVLPVSGPPSRH